eukprot:6212692-Pleurochrysis_carterae.AAC.4
MQATAGARSLMRYGPRPAVVRCSRGFDLHPGSSTVSNRDNQRKRALGGVERRLLAREAGADSPKRQQSRSQA